MRSTTFAGLISGTLAIAALTGVSGVKAHAGDIGPVTSAISADSQASTGGFTVRQAVPASAVGIQIASRVDSGVEGQWGQSGVKTANTVFSGDGSVTTQATDDGAPAPNRVSIVNGLAIRETAPRPSAAEVASASAGRSGAAPVASGVDWSSVDSSGATMPSNTQSAEGPYHKSKFKKLIFASALISVIAVFAFARAKRTPSASAWEIADLAPRPKPIAGITIGSLNQRTQPVYNAPANHPWYS